MQICLMCARNDYHAEISDGGSNNDTPRVVFNLKIF